MRVGVPTDVIVLNRMLLPPLREREDVSSKKDSTQPVECASADEVTLRILDNTVRYRYFEGYMLTSWEYGLVLRRRNYTPSTPSPPEDKSAVPVDHTSSPAGRDCSVVTSIG